MSIKLNELKEKFQAQLEVAKIKVEEAKDSAKTSVEDAKEKVKTKVAEAKVSFSEVQAKAEEKKAEVESSITAFELDRSAAKAKRRAEHAEEYAISCIAMVDAAVIEADSAIANAIIAAAEAEELN